MLHMLHMGDIVALDYLYVALHLHIDPLRGLMGYRSVMGGPSILSKKKLIQFESNRASGSHEGQPNYSNSLAAS